MHASWNCRVGRGSFGTVSAPVGHGYPFSQAPVDLQASWSGGVSRSSFNTDLFIGSSPSNTSALPHSPQPPRTPPVVATIPSPIPRVLVELKASATQPALPTIEPIPADSLLAAPPIAAKPLSLTIKATATADQFPTAETSTVTGPSPFAADELPHPTTRPDAAKVLSPAARATAAKSSRLTAKAAVNKPLLPAADTNTSKAIKLQSPAAKGTTVVKPPSPTKTTCKPPTDDLPGRGSSVRVELVTLHKADSSDRLGITLSGMAAGEASGNSATSNPGVHPPCLSSYTTP